MKEFDEFEYADLENDAKKEMEYEEFLSRPNVFNADSYKECEGCKETFFVEDLDLVNCRWYCRSCEEDLK